MYIIRMDMKFCVIVNALPDERKQNNGKQDGRLGTPQTAAPVRLAE